MCRRCYFVLLGSARFGPGGLRLVVLRKFTLSVGEEVAVTNPPGWKPDDGKSARIISIDIDAKTLTGMAKEGHADQFTVFCDEAERLGGTDTAPSPMRYMALAVAF